MLPGKVLMKFHFQAAGVFCLPETAGIRHLKRRNKKKERKKTNVELNLDNYISVLTSDLPPKSGSLWKDCDWQMESFLPFKFPATCWKYVMSEDKRIRQKKQA